MLPEESDDERDEKEDGEGEDCYKTRGDGGGRGGCVVGGRWRAWGDICLNFVDARIGWGWDSRLKA